MLEDGANVQLVGFQETRGDRDVRIPEHMVGGERDWGQRTCSSGSNSKDWVISLDENKMGRPRDWFTKAEGPTATRKFGVYFPFEMRAHGHIWPP